MAFDSDPSLLPPAVGMLTIVRLGDLRFYGRESRWLPIPRRIEDGGQMTDD